MGDEQLKQSNVVFKDSSMDYQSYRNFYNRRYSESYMNHWAKSKCRKVSEIITTLNLPETGFALDFGCGNGIFTRVLKQALPGWQIYGCDISEVAISNASEKIANCQFFLLQPNITYELKFDFVFSHHVLEHVLNLKDALETINLFCKETATMLHIAPCGNKGSLEYFVAETRINGIETDMEDRFFFEDESHVRRLDTLKLDKALENYGFKLIDNYYDHHTITSILYLSKSTKDFIKFFADSGKSRKEDYDKIKIIRNRLLILNFWQKIYNISTQFQSIFSAILQLLISIRQLLISSLKIILFPAAAGVVIYYTLRSSREWKKQKKVPDGSEMYLIFNRK